MLKLIKIPYPQSTTPQKAQKVKGSSKMQIEIKNITKKFDQTKVLDQVSLHLETGLFGLLGANGASKTTLIRILATLLEPTSGEILYNNQPIRNKKEMRQRIGYILQKFSFYLIITIFETLNYFYSLAGMKKNQRKACWYSCVCSYTSSLHCCLSVLFPY